MRKLESFGVFLAVMFLCGAIIFVDAVPVFASSENNAEEYQELVEEAEMEVQGLSLEELDNKLAEVSEEIDETIIEENGSLSSAKGDALEYATDEEIAMLGH